MYWFSYGICAFQINSKSSRFFVSNTFSSLGMVWIHTLWTLINLVKKMGTISVSTSTEVVKIDEEWIWITWWNCKCLVRLKCKHSCFCSSIRSGRCCESDDDMYFLLLFSAICYHYLICWMWIVINIVDVQIVLWVQCTFLLHFCKS